MTAERYSRQIAVAATLVIAVATGAFLANANPELGWPVVANTIAFAAVLGVFLWRRDHILESPLGPMLIVVATSGFGPAFFGYLKPVAHLGISAQDYEVASTIWLLFVTVALVVYVLSTSGSHRAEDERAVDIWRSVAVSTNQRLIVIWTFSLLAALLVSLTLVADAGGFSAYIDSLAERRGIFEGRVYLKAVLMAPAVTALAILALHGGHRRQQSKLLIGVIVAASGLLLLIMGSRLQPVVFAAAAAVVWHYAVSRLAVRHVVIGFIAVYLFGAGLSGLTRGLEADRQAFVSPTDAWAEIQWSGPISDFGQLPAVAMIAKAYDSDNYELGRTYAAAATVMIPSAIAPWKLPSGGAVVSERVTPSQFADGTALLTSFPGEGFANFGWPGVILAGSVFALLMKWVRRLSSPASLGALLLFALLLPRVALLFREDLANVVAFLGIDLLLLFGLLTLANIPRPWFQSPPSETPGLDLPARG